MELKLEGMFFLTFPNENKPALHQGRILRKIDDGFYICQMFSWLTGSGTCLRITHLKEMTKFHLYSDQESFLTAAQKEIDRREIQPNLRNSFS